MATASEAIQDSTIRNAIFLQRYNKRTLRKIVAALNKSADRIATEIARRDPGSGSFTDRRLALLLEAVKNLNVEAMRIVEGTTLSDARDLATAEAEGLVTSIGRAVPVDFDIVTPAPNQLWAAVSSRPFNGRLLKDYFRDLPRATFARVEAEITQGFIEGRTTDQIVRSIRGTKANRYKDGVLEINKRSAETVVRTALNHTANAARNETYKQNADLIKGVKWVSTLDGRTSAVCMARDGQVYEPDKGPRPPAHLNCRSSTTPVLKSWKELGISLKEAPEGTRASMNGQVPGSETYQSWLKKQPETFQDEVLGPTKAKLFRDGGLTLDRFVDASGDEYTIDQLKSRYGEEWRRAFGGAAKTSTKATKPAPKPEAMTPTQRRAAIWRGRSGDEITKVAPAFAGADPDRLEVITRIGKLTGGVNAGKGSHYTASKLKIQMDSKHTGAAFDRVMRHEYGHHIDSQIEIQMGRKLGWDERLTGRGLGVSRFAYKEMAEDAKILAASVSDDAQNAWTGKTIKATEGFKAQVTKTQRALLNKFDDVAEAGGDVDAAVRAEYAKRGLDLDEARKLFPHVFEGENPKSGTKIFDAQFLGAFDNRDHKFLVYDGGRNTAHASALAGMSDSLGAITNQSIGYHFGHPKSYYEKARNYDRRVSRWARTIDAEWADGIAPSRGRYTYGSGNATQMFANWTEAYTSGIRTQYAVFRQMFPRTSARFEQILEEFVESGTIS